MQFDPPSAEGPHLAMGGFAASPQILSIVVSLLCFVIAAGFLLSLVPDPRRQAPVTTTRAPADEAAEPVATAPANPVGLAAMTSPRLMPAPLGGIRQTPRAMSAPPLA